MARALLLLLVCGHASARPETTFAVLGDRTGSARPRVFAQIVDEIKLLNPDFILSVGDLVEGYTEDQTRLGAEWDSVLGLIRSVGVPFHACPGNHDIFDPASESVFIRRVGPRRRALRLGRTSFIIFDNSRWPSPESLPRSDLRWLETELARASRSQQTFVLMHRPYWRAGLEQDRPDPLHELFRRYGVDCVFTGHDHFYCTHTQDRVRYFQVGPSGSRTKAHEDRELGAFQNYLWCRISGDSVEIAVREPGQYTALPADVVSWETIQAIRRVRREVVEVLPVVVPLATHLATETRVTLRNLTAMPASGEFCWHDSGTAWRIAPDRMNYTLAPQGSLHQSFAFSLAGSLNVYPLPWYTMPFEYRPGKKTVLEARLPVRREARLITVRTRPLLDGRLDDPCWQTQATLAGFGDRNGNQPLVESCAVWVGADDSLLLLAIRCRESDTGRMTTAVLDRDARVYDDDHVNIVLGLGADSVYYQVFVNAAGTIADRRCVMRGSQSSKDLSWNGNWRAAARKAGDHWTAELSCPLADFGPRGDTWSINAVRLQSRLEETAVWQVPFTHDPRTFGRLSR
jgi:predicted phosphodiesterase